MKKELLIDALLRVAGAVVIMTIAASTATAKEPCGGLGECKALIEINSTDGDIGFHFLMDGDDLVAGKVQNPEHKTIFKTEALRELREQYFTETFVESAEPLCFDPLTDEDPENDEDDFTTLKDFMELWSAGTYKFIGVGADERSVGYTKLKFNFPAAPTNLNFDDENGIVSWAAGNDLGACATKEELDVLVAGGDLPQHPKNVAVAAWEVVFEPDVEDGDPTGSLKFSIRVPGDIAVNKVKVPRRYRDALPDDTPIKIEVGAIGHGDNATFTELSDICINEVMGCEEDE